MNYRYGVFQMGSSYLGVEKSELTHHVRSNHFGWSKTAILFLIANIFYRNCTVVSYFVHAT